MAQLVGVIPSGQPSFSDGRPIFVEKQWPLSAQPFTLGGTNTFQLDQTSVLTGMSIVIQGTMTAAATAAVEGLPALIQGVTINVSGTNFGTLTPVINLTGPDLYEAYPYVAGQAPFNTGGLGTSAVFRLEIPISFLQNFFWGAQRYRTALPMFAMSSGQVQIQAATQAQIDVATTPTAALTSASIWIQQYRCYPETVPVEALDSSFYIRDQTEVQEYNSQIVTTNQGLMQLPNAGWYSMMLLRSFSGANTRQSNTGNAPFAYSSTARIDLQDLTANTKNRTSFRQLIADNSRVMSSSAQFPGATSLYSTTTPGAGMVEGNAAFLFNRNPNQLYNAGLVGAGSNFINIYSDWTAATGAKIRLVYRRMLPNPPAAG